MEILGLSIGQFATILSMVLTVATAVLGPKYAKMRKLFTIVVNAAEDDNLEKAEMKKIVQQIKDL